MANPRKGAGVCPANAGSDKKCSVKGVSGHHIRYDPEWVVYVTKGEHLILSRLAWYTKKRVSQGLITALLQFCLENYSRAESLGEEKK